MKLICSDFRYAAQLSMKWSNEIRSGGEILEPGSLALIPARENYSSCINAPHGEGESAQISCFDLNGRECSMSWIKFCEICLYNFRVINLLLGLMGISDSGFS
jgi:hypothetical protein